MHTLVLGVSKTKRHVKTLREDPNPKLTYCKYNYLC